ncbi:Ribosome-binding factor A [Porphyridium purpureum]|uniref:Ribosome-binding factor A n=1 Tax=Porphyridium purpureum TaxID=35688 RepID=A0A5J4Z6Z3_PORPP|nr:Ribosome-binding factor A [Porphyridium purpureum]|eukprot:POR4522..scf295_1
MERRRPNRVAEMIKREISMVLRDQYTTHARFHGLPSWSTLMLSVMDVNVSPDLRNARIEVSMAQADMSRVLKWLNGNRRTLRYEMAQRMTHMKIMPDLYFKESGAGGAFRTVSILDELAKKRELVAATTNFDDLEADSDDEDASDEEFDLDSGTNEDFDLDASASNKLK